MAGRNGMTKILENFWLKIMALVMGLVLWFHVATEKEYNHEITLPVNEILLDESLTLANLPPDSITIAVAATGKQLLRSKWQRRGVRINATPYGTGRSVINLSTDNVSLVSAPTEIFLDEVISPSSVSLDIDQEIVKELDVTVDLVTEPDEGFVVSRISPPSPSKVTVTGARSFLRKLHEVSTQRKELTKLRHNLDVSLKLQPPEGYDIRLSPDSVKVTINVVPVKTRVFEEVPVVIYNAPVGESVRAVPPSINLELTGPPKDIDLLNRNALVVSADYRERDGNNNAPIKIDCPSHYRVKEASVDSVKLVAE